MSLSQNLAPYDGELYLIKQFYAPEAATKLLEVLLAGLAWQEEQIFIFGRWVKVPRLMCWYGDQGARYKYSHVDHDPLPWTNNLRQIQRDIESFSGYEFNSVLGNLYRDGNDSMGCHADDEKELGLNPVIASLSLGATRDLKFTHKTSKAKLSLPLAHGDLLIMTGSLQHHWLHHVPKTKKAVGLRCNLTFRKIL